MLKQELTRRKFLKRSLKAGGGIIALQGVSPLSVLAKPKVKLPQKIVFLGDSITMAGGYINVFEYYLRLRYPNWQGEIINMGLSSETISGLSEPDHPFPRPYIHHRLRSVLSYTQPQLVFICYGMNCGIYHPFSNDRFDAYKAGMIGLVNLVKSRGADMVLLTPPPFAHKGSPITQLASNEDYGYDKPFEGYDQVLKGYGTWLQANYKGEYPVVDTHAALTPYKNLCYGKDIVHPNQYGHFIMAHAILQELGLLKITVWKENVKTVSETEPVTIQTPYQVILPETVLMSEENPLAMQIASLNALSLKLKGAKRQQNYTVKLPNNTALDHYGRVWRNGIEIQNELVKASDSIPNEQAKELWYLISKKREIYDRALLNEVGHNRPNVDSVPFVEAQKFKAEFEQKLILLKPKSMIKGSVTLV